MTHIANAITEPKEFEITSEMMAAGVDYLEGVVLTLVESESSRFESTIRELFRVMIEARCLSTKQIPEMT